MATSSRILVLALIALLFEGSTAAQLLNEEFQPLVRSADFSLILDELSPSDDEETILRTFYEDFQTNFIDAAEKAKARIWAINQRRQQARQSNPDQLVPDLGLTDAQNDWLRTRRELEDQFEQDVSVILSADRLAQWKVVGRRIRRERGFAHAKSVRNIRHTADLIDVLDDLEIAHSDALQNIVSDYSADLDQAIREFEFNHHSLFRRYTELRSGSPADETRQEEIREAYEAWSRYPDAINSLNDAYASRIADTIQSEDQVSKFRFEVMRREYEAVFVLSPVEHVLDALDDFNELTDGERRALQQIADSYRGAQAARREMIVNALRQWESPAEVAHRSRQYQEIRKNGGDPYDVERKHPALPLWEADNRAVRQTCQAIRSIFPEHRFRELPIRVQVLLGW